LQPIIAFLSASNQIERYAGVFPGKGGSPGGSERKTSRCVQKQSKPVPLLIQNATETCAITEKTYGLPDRSIDGSVALIDETTVSTYTTIKKFWPGISDGVSVNLEWMGEDAEICEEFNLNVAVEVGLLKKIREKMKGMSTRANSHQSAYYTYKTSSRTCFLKFPSGFA
jgi:hypothetical protein